jgi:hypothetical protein
MKYLVAGTFRGAWSGPAGTRHPLQVVEKATRIRGKYKCDGGHGKARHASCMISPGKLRDGQIIGIFGRWIHKE